MLIDVLPVAYGTVAHVIGSGVGAVVSEGYDQLVVSNLAAKAHGLEVLSIWSPTPTFTSRVLVPELRFTAIESS